MFPLRLSLFALLLLAVLVLSQEAEADAPTIELLTPQSDSWVPASSSDDFDIFFTWNSTDADDDATDDAKESAATANATTTTTTTAAPERRENVS